MGELKNETHNRYEQAVRDPCIADSRRSHRAAAPLMHAEDLHEKDDCVYRGESFLSNGTEDAEAVRAIETVEAWLRKQYPQPR